ncbi:MAG: hypothetical protein LBJ67_00375 [Planctomycetaceae bacterium]|jgi:ribonuclease HIII|nr:hypothetical protein [Planctomycetaceae bacterium]
MQKNYVLGTDEAGYGPNLGPLVVGCTAWEVFYDKIDILFELENRLSNIIASTPVELKNCNKILVIGDSKKLCQSGNIHTLLETLIPVFQIINKPVTSWQELLKAIADKDVNEILNSKSQFFICEDHLLLNNPAFEKNVEKIKKMFLQAEIILKNIAARVISPKIFNELLESLGNKSTLLTHVTMTLILSVLEMLSESRVTILCDKHGGRNRYVDVLYHFFPDCSVIEIVTEGTPLSVYRFQHLNKNIEFRFQSKADSHIPAALASMTAKLLRELAMQQFNLFWKKFLPNLKPTAGYPVDAIRFFAQIEQISKSIEIPKTEIWREK